MLQVLHKCKEMLTNIKYAPKQNIITQADKDGRPMAGNMN